MSTDPQVAALEARVRETPLEERLRDCITRIAVMCSESRPPRMSIPVEWRDDDFFITTTLEDAIRFIAMRETTLDERAST